MTRLLFGPGARGESIRTLQQKLTDAGFGTNGVDGDYGNGTVVAAWSQQLAWFVLTNWGLDEFPAQA